MIISSAKMEDQETVRDITITTIKEIYPQYYPMGAVAFFLEHHNCENIAEDIKAKRVYVLEGQDIAVGTVTIKGCEICRLFVLPQYQGRGYGRQLLEFAEKKVFHNNMAIRLDASFPAKKIYLKRGYEIVEFHSIVTENGDYLCYDVVEKKKSFSHEETDHAI